MSLGRRLRLRKIVGIIISLVLLTINYTDDVLAVRQLSADVHIQANERYELPIKNDGLFYAEYEDKALAVMQNGETRNEAAGTPLQKVSNVTIKLFGVLPVKNVNVHVRRAVELVPGGTSIGVTLHTRGALVVGLSDIALRDGNVVSPAASAGIQVSDIIERANGTEVQNANQLALICNESSSGVRLSVLRGSRRFETELHPALDPKDNQYRMGMWVRDSTAGVGTLSFYDPATNWFAALGHAITDIDTRTKLTVRDGEVVQSKIIDIVQGTQGEPGELRGTFNAMSKPLGAIKMNDDYGIYGNMYEPFYNPLYRQALPMAYPEQAHTGHAQLLTTIDDEGIKPYDCKIVKTNPQASAAQKGMVIEITDPLLLKATGGIVQGMSGSPIIQDGRIIGVVTHVFINDPTKGYCMYAQWMHDKIA